MEIIVLKLEHDMYYVGNTKTPNCEWTTLHKPIEVDYVFPATHLTEHVVVIWYMKRFGTHRVRGGPYSEVTLRDDQWREIMLNLVGPKRRSSNYTDYSSGDESMIYPIRRIYKYKGLYDLDDVGFECRCGVQFETDIELEEHKKEYKCEAPFWCHECQTGFENTEPHLCKEYWDCDDCNYRFDTEQEFQEHTCSNDEHYCMDCGILFGDKSEYEDHRKNHDVWLCRICDSTFYSKVDYIYHASQQSLEKCTTCDDHKDHEGNCVRTHKYRCHTCGEGFTNQEEKYEGLFGDHLASCSLRLVN